MLNIPISQPDCLYSLPKDTKDPRIKDWIVQNTGSTINLNEDWDVVLFGVPLSRSSISVSGASEFPEHFRRLWKTYSTYNLDYDLDLQQLKVFDFGDVKMHFTDILLSHENIKTVMEGVRKQFPKSIPVAIGGDHSITAMLVAGLKVSHPNKTIGILQFDTHLDLRSLEDHGPTNGTPIRNLIENGIVSGSNVYNIGLHGFFNTHSLLSYAKENGVNCITLKKAREKGIQQTVREALRALEEKVDVIYITIDMDVLDVAFAPGVPASTTGGMMTQELFDAVYEAAKTDKLAGMDIVCLDPTRDGSALPTVKAGLYTFLTFLTGMSARRG